MKSFSITKIAGLLLATATLVSASPAFAGPASDAIYGPQAAALDNCNLANTLLSAPSLDTPDFISGYKKGCVLGYKQASEVEHIIENVRDPFQGTFCKSLVSQFELNSTDTAIFNFAVGVVSGCRYGVVRAWAFTPPPTPTAQTIDTANVELNNCNITGAPTSSDVASGRAQGCLDGYTNEGQPDYTVADCYAGRSTTDPYTRFADYNRGYIAGCTAGLQIATADRAAGAPKQKLAPLADSGNNTGLGIVPKCDPSLPPAVKRGDRIADPANPGQTIVARADACGINKLVELIKNIMDYLFVIVIPLAVLAIGWAGFQIMTAGGNTEKVSAGVGTMKLAVTGIAIMLASYFIVQIIFKALGVSSSFLPGGI